MADEISGDPTERLGRRLLHRAASPGVIRPDLARRIQRRSFAGGAALGAEIWRRWFPAASSGGSQDVGLPYFGFGRFGAAADASPGTSASGPAGAARPARPAPTARAVDVSEASPAAEALSSLGARLQRRHLGGPGGRWVQRRATASSSTSSNRKTSAVAMPQRFTVDDAGHPGEGWSEGSPVPFAGPGAEPGPAILPRGVGQPASGRLAAEPVRSSAVAALAPRSLQAIAEMGPPIVRRAAGRGPAQRMSLGTASAGGPIQMKRASVPVSNAAADASLPLPLAELDPPGPEGPAVAAPIQRAVVAGSATPAPQPPLEFRAAEGGSLPATLEMGPAIVRRAAGRRAAGSGPAQRASLGTASAGGPIQMKRAPARVSDATTDAAPALPLVQLARPEPVASAVSVPIQRNTASGSTSSVGATLPVAPFRGLVPARQLSAGSAGPGSVQLRSCAKAPVQPTAAASPAPAAAALPLALFRATASRNGPAPVASTGGPVVQRCGSDRSGDDGGTILPPADGSEKSSRAAAGIDLEDIVERVMRRLTRSLTADSERHGGRRWL